MDSKMALKHDVVKDRGEDTRQWLIECPITGTLVDADIGMRALRFGIFTARRPRMPQKHMTGFSSGRKKALAAGTQFLTVISRRRDQPRIVLPQRRLKRRASLMANTGYLSASRCMSCTVGASTPK
jgi:hypothetical protein